MLSLLSRFLEVRVRSLRVTINRGLNVAVVPTGLDWLFAGEIPLIIGITFFPV